jgi:phosphoserine phosphatase RsbU/P
MLSLLLLGLLVLTAGSFYVVHRRLRRQLRGVQKRLDDLKTEESRVFEFLHGLGSAFSDALRPTELHRMIVEGAARILDAHGGALYLVDRAGAMLIPTFISKGCPPLIAVPPHILQQAATTPVALDSYLRLHPVPLEHHESPVAGAVEDDSILSSVWLNKQPLFLPSAEHDPRLTTLRDTSLRTESAIVAPLLYAGENLGVLALANGPMGVPFTEIDFEVFQAITEQSAFALYNAIVYSEANEKKRLDRDLEIARDIQRILLPSTSPDVPGYEISGINIPARQVSGDYFDYIRVDADHFGIVIADVSGKGVPASIVAATLQGIIHALMLTGQGLPEIAALVNRFLCTRRVGKYATMVLLKLHSDGEAEYINCGHIPPLLVTASGARSLKESNLIVGLIADASYESSRCRLAPGERILLVTDGITEAENSAGEQFGDAELDRVIQLTSLGAMLDCVAKFQATNEAQDDWTLVDIRYEGDSSPAVA